MYRDELEQAMQQSGLSLSLDAPPRMIDDPTSEIKRLHFEVRDNHSQDINLL